MNKRIVKYILLIFIFSIFLLSKKVFADNPISADGNWEYEIKYGTATVVKYLGNEKNVVIPDNIDGYTVTRIEFIQDKNIESIKIPGTVDVIGISGFGFAECTNLKTVEIEEGNLNEIDRFTFANCINLTQVILPSNIKTIEEYAFKGCENLESFTIPTDVTQIDTKAFYGCKKLSNFTINSSDFVKQDGVLYNKDKTTMIFYPSTKTNKEFTILNTINEVETYCIENEYLETINIPSNLNIIREKAFGKCVNLQDINVDSSNEKYSSEDGVLFNKDKTKLVLYPSGRRDPNFVVRKNLKEIESGAFFDSKYLTNIMFEDDVDFIYEKAFGQNHVIYCDGDSYVAYYCSENGYPYCEFDLKVSGNYAYRINEDNTSCRLYLYFGKEENVIVPDELDGYKVTTIEQDAYDSNLHIKTIKIGKNINELLGNRFLCKNLVSVTVDDGNEYFCAEDGILYNKDKTRMVCFPSSKRVPGDVYTIPSNVTKLAPHCFNSNQYLRVINIDGEWFKCGYYDMTNFVFSPNLEEINVTNNSRFYTVDGIVFSNDSLNIYPSGKKDKKYIVPDGIKTVNYFVANYYLEEVVMNEDVEMIMQNAFQSCSNLKKATFNCPKMTHIKSSVFLFCDSLKEVILPENIKTIPNFMFENCTGLENVTIPENIEYVGVAAFRGCRSLKEITIPKNVTSIGYEAFHGCEDLEKVIVKNPNCEFYYDDIFEDCEKVVIYCYKDSKAQEYAISHDIPYVLMDEEPIEKAELEAIGITAFPTKTKYIEGENFDPSGMQVTAYYSDGSSKVITGYQINIQRPLTTEDDHVLVSYEENGKEAKMIFPIEVKAKTIEDTEVVWDYIFNEIDKKYHFMEGQVIDKNHVKVYVIYNNGNREEITNYTIEPNRPLQVGDKEITVKFEKDKTVFSISSSIIVESTKNIYVNIKEYTEEQDGVYVYLTGIQPKTSINDALNNITTNGEIEFYDKDNNKVTNYREYVKTGMTLKITKDEEKREFVLSVKGDTNGDGNANFSDMLLINKHRLNKKKLEGAYLKAGDIDGNKLANFSDMLKINKYRLGKIKTL